MRRQPRNQGYVPITEVAAAALENTQGRMGGVLEFTLYAPHSHAPMPGAWRGAEITDVLVKWYPKNAFIDAHWHIQMLPGGMWCTLPPDMPHEQAHATAVGMMDIANLRRIHE